MSYGSTSTVGVSKKLPLDADRLKYFRTEVARARQLRDDRMSAWDVEGNLARYQPPKKSAEGVNTGVDFADVETKKAALFYDTPTVHVKPDPECPPEAALLHQDLLNHQLLEMQAKGTALKCLQDCLVAIQPAFTKIGYLSTVVEVDQPVLQPSLDAMGQMTQVPAVDPQTGQPVTQKVPVVVHEEFFWSRVSGKSGLLPADFKDTEYDKAPWIGYHWRKPVSQVRREYGLPDTWVPKGDGEQRLTFTDDEQTPDTSGETMCTGVYLEYRAHLVDPAIQHPALRRCLVLVDGYDEPVKHEDVPWQAFDQEGWLTPDSLDGSTIHPLVLRDLPDSAWVPADSSITGPLTKELNEYRTKIVRQRDGSVLVFTFDSARLNTEDVEKIKTGQQVGYWVNGALWVPVESGAIQNGQNSAIAQVPTLTQGRESYLGQEIIEHDRDRILGISRLRSGGDDQAAKTATEQTLLQRNSDARFEQERQRAMGDWWLRGAAKLSTLLVRYGDRVALRVLGQQRGQRWMQFKQQGVLGRFAYELKIDSGKYIDVEADRRQWLQLYNMTGKDPNVNRVEILKRVFQAWGIDPAVAVVEQLPDPKPEPPKLSFAIKGEDLNPAMPQYPAIVDLMRQTGIEISVPAVQLSQQQAQSLAMVGRSPKTAESPNDPIEAATSSGPLPTAGVGPNPKQPQPPPMHGGGMPRGEPISQHQMDESGGLSGPGPM